MDAEEDGDDPGAKKQRIGEAFHRVRKDTFVEQMLVGVSTTLASDAEHGYNSSNRIRRRVEEIASAIDETKQSPDSMSSSRAVLESRFALGADDSQYLSQAVSLLWAGDGGEKLRVAPIASMPEVMRAASARGIVRAMGGVVKRHRKQAEAKINRALRLAGWLMQVKVIREAILKILAAGCVDEEVSITTGRAIAAAFDRGGSDAGTAMVADLYNVADMDPGPANSLITAFVVLTNPESAAAGVVDKLVESMNETVEKVESSLAQLFNTAVQMDGASGRVLDTDTPGVVQWRNPIQSNAGVKHAQYCTVFRDYDPRVERNEPTEFGEFATAVSEAVGRISGVFTGLKEATDANATDFDKVQVTAGGTFSNVSDPVDAIPVAGAAERGTNGKAWFLHGVLSPMWQGKVQEEWASNLGMGYYHTPAGAESAFQGTGSRPAGTGRKSNYVASVDMKSAVYEHNRGREVYHGKLAEFGSRFLDGKTVTNESFAQFCMTRGLCGFRGIHQLTNGADDEVVNYDYPSTNLPKYTRGEFADLDRVDMSAELKRKVQECEDQLYNDTCMELDTDFFGNATKTVRPARPMFSVNNDDTSTSADQARRAAWLPVNAPGPRQGSINMETFSQAVCEASVYEFMTLSLTNPSCAHEDEMEVDLMKAAAAVAKIRQIQLHAVIKSTDPGDVMHSADKMGGDVYVTRPCSQCAAPGVKMGTETLLFPPDAGIACFKKHDDSAQEQLKINEPDADTVRHLHPYFMAVSVDTPVPNVSLSSFLASGMQIGWEDPPRTDANEEGVQLPREARSSRTYGLYIGPSACSEPFDDSRSYAYHTATQDFKMDPDDLTIESLFSTFVNATDAFDTIKQMDCEEQYVNRFRNESSQDAQSVFGIHRSMEDATRDRRADIWLDALREVAISGDRLYRFVTELTGAIGEAADSAISWEDEDLKAMSKEASNRQKAMAERVSRFQTKLVESVVSATLKASKLQLDVRSDPGNELVVINTDVRDGIRQITSGEAGHGFFEASVEINNLLGSASKPITIRNLVTKLRNVSMEFQDQLKDSLSVSTPASFSRISEPRNSFMLHLKPDTVAAVHKAFDLMTSEMRICPGYHRHVYLWEYVEGKDWVLSSRFAELVGLMLQNTRMRSGSFAAYVGTSQIITNTQNVRMQIQRLKTQVCSYIAHVDKPQFLTPAGRTFYFGGTVSETPADAAQSGTRRSTMDSPAPFGGDSDGGWWNWGRLAALPPSEFAVRDSVTRRINDVHQGIRSGKLQRDSVSLTSEERLKFLADPRLQRRGFQGLTQGQIMSATHRWLTERMLTFGKRPEDLYNVVAADAALSYTNARYDTASKVVVQNIDPNDQCSPCRQKYAERWNELFQAFCTQFSEQTDVPINSTTCKFDYSTLEKTKQGRNYVVRFEVPEQHLIKRTLVATVNSVLNELLPLKPQTQRNYKWRSSRNGDNTWLRAINDREDRSFANALTFTEQLRSYAATALGYMTSPRLIMAGLATQVLIGLTLNKFDVQQMSETVTSTLASLGTDKVTSMLDEKGLGPDNVASVWDATATTVYRHAPFLYNVVDSTAGLAASTLYNLDTNVRDVSEWAWDGSTRWYSHYLPVTFANGRLAAWEHRSKAARIGRDLFSKDATERGSRMLNLYKNEESLLEIVKPIIERLVEHAGSENADGIKEIIADPHFVEFQRHDLSMEVLDKAFDQNPESTQAFAECAQVLDDLALTVTSMQQCVMNLDERVIPKLLNMNPRQLQESRAKFQSYISQQETSAIRRLSTTRDGALNATTTQEYKGADPSDAARFAPFTIDVINRYVRKNGEGHSNMINSVDGMLENLDLEIKRNAGKQEEAQEQQYPQPPSFYLLEQEKKVLELFKRRLRVGKANAEQGVTSAARKSGYTATMQEDMVPVWSFLTWSVADQLRFQGPIAMAFSTVMSLATYNEDPMTVEEYAANDDFKESMLEVFGKIPNINSEEAEKVRKILARSSGKTADTQYIEILELTLQAAARKMIEDQLAALKSQNARPTQSDETAADGKEDPMADPPPLSSALT